MFSNVENFFAAPEGAPLCWGEVFEKLVDILIHGGRKMCYRKTVVAVVGIVCFPICVAASLFAGEMRTKGEIEKVVAYQGQALVTRRVPADLEEGEHELVITELPEHIIPESLYAEGVGALHVRSTRYRERAVEEDIRDEVRELDRRINTLELKIKHLESRLGVLSQRSAYLDSLEKFVSSGAREELTKGVLNAETLMELSGYLFEQRQQIAEEKLELQTEKDKTGREIDTVRRQRSMITGRSTHTVKEAVVFVECGEDVLTELELSYLVGRVNWNPSYTARVGEERGEVVLEYLASLHQQSGEDWEDVRIELSTAGPRLSSQAPQLDPLMLELSQKGIEEAKDEFLRRRDHRSLEDAFVGVMTGQRGVEVERLRETKAGREQIRRLNVLGGERQMLELFGVSEAEALPGLPEEVPTVTYYLPGRTSVPSRRDRQSFRITTERLPAEFYKKAIPVLSEYVYEEGDVVNNAETVLLAGPITSYVGGEFVGEAELPTVIKGEPFVLGLGVKSGLRTGRRVVEREESVKGGNRVLELIYRLTIENFGPEPAVIRLKDRMPSTKNGEFVAEITDLTHELSDDEYYVENRKPEGILRWDVLVPENVSGLDAYTVEYTLRIEHDRHKTFSDPAAF